MNIYETSLTDPRLAKHLTLMRGYSIRTYYNIIKQQGHVSNTYRHPKHKRKWNDEAINTCRRIIKENPLLT